MNRLLGFYYGGFPDHRGRFLAEITRQDDLWLEVTHDYIQWLFPNRDMSPINPQAPVITKKIRAAFIEDELLRRHLLASFARMLAFYGLRRREGRIVKAENWRDRKSDWFVQPTHNDLRITRILKCLSELGLRPEAQVFLDALESLRDEPDCGLSETAYGHWRKAL